MTRQAKRKQSPVEVNYFQASVVCSVEETEPLEIQGPVQNACESLVEENPVAQVQEEVQVEEPTPMVEKSEDVTNKDEEKKVDVELEDEEDPLGFIQIKSAAQWKAVSKRISWNFEDKKDEEPINIPIIPSKETVIKHQVFKDDKPPLHDYDNIEFDMYCPEYDGSLPDFKPTK